MSIIRMRETMHSWFRYVMIAIAVVMAVGIAWQLGGGSGRNQQSDRASRGGIVAKVNGEKLDSETFAKAYANALSQVAQQQNLDKNEPGQVESIIGPLQAEMLRGQVLDKLTNTMILVQAAKEQGVRVSRGEVKKAIAKIVEDQVAQIRKMLVGDSKSDKKFEEALAKVKPGTTIGSLRTEIKEFIDPDEMRQQLVIQKLMDSVKKDVDRSDRAVRASFDQYRLAQISVGNEKRSDTQARARAKEIVEKLRGGADFAALAKEVSEDPYKTNGGDWGFALPKMYIAPVPVKKAIEKMKPGEISNPIKVEDGYMVVKLISRESKLPADYAEKRKEYRDRYVAQAEQAAQSEFFEKVSKSAKTEIIDPEMKALSMLRKGGADRKAVFLGAIREYNRAVAKAEDDAGMLARAYSQIAYIYEALRQPGIAGVTEAERAKYAVEEKGALISALNNTESKDLRLMLADLRIQDKEFAEAVDDLSYVSANGYDDPAAHQELLGRYEKMRAAGYSKVASLIAEERKWLDDYSKQAEKSEGPGVSR
ncbi:MAG: peptidylprolyl isomerase [Armatimonadota bacterium]